MKPSTDKELKGWVRLLVALWLGGWGLFFAFFDAKPAVLPPLAPPAPGTTRARIDWSNYDTNKLSTNLTFRVHWSSTMSASLTNWLIVATLVGTNTVADVVIPNVDGNSFFAVSGSNLFGQAFFSNIATLSPPVDTLVPVKINGAVRP